MYIYLYLRPAQKLYCAYQSYVYIESKVIMRGFSTGPRRPEPSRPRVERANSRRDEPNEGRRELCFRDKRYPHIQRKSGDHGAEQQEPRPILALPAAELEMLAAVLDATVLLKKKDSKPLVDA